MSATTTHQTGATDPATLAAGPSELLTFAGLTVDPPGRMLFLAGQAPIGLGADQTRVLELLIQRRGEHVSGKQIEQETVNTAATTVDSLNSLLRSVGALSAIVLDRQRGFQLLDSTADLSLSFADLRLNQITRLLVIHGRKPVTMSPQNTAVLGLLMQARGGPVTGRELNQVTARTAPGAAVGNLCRRLKNLGIAVDVVNDRSCGWRLVNAA